MYELNDQGTNMQICRNLKKCLGKKRKLPNLAMTKLFLFVAPALLVKPVAPEVVSVSADLVKLQAVQAALADTLSEIKLF